MTAAGKSIADIVSVLNHQVKRKRTFAALEFRQGRRWKGLCSVVYIRAERRIGDTVTVEKRDYINCFTGDAPQVLAASRSHWEIKVKQAPMGRLR